MQKLKKLYRSTYDGETMTTSSTWTGSQWEYTQEYIPNAVTNDQTSRHAVVIGNGSSRKKYELHLLKNHKGGAFGSQALQTYGCNALYREFDPTLVVATGPEICREIAESGYCHDHIVYANAEIIAQYPGRFYLIPQDVHYNSGALAAYLACFDGHQKVYLMGFDCSAGANYNNNIYAGTQGYAGHDHNYTDNLFVTTMMQVMETYDDVEFIRVMPTIDWYCPDAWKGLLNFKQITYNEFAIEVNL
jgi:hypothetical protein